jgi:hypothetical protein
MSPIFVPATSPDDWQRLLADPVKHWRTGYSARTLAYSWHDSQGWPPEIQQMFASASEPSLRSAQPLIVIPERITPVAGKGQPPHSDVFVLAKAADGHLMSITVEGKVDEPFGSGNETVAAWKSAGNTANRRIRLDQLLDKIQLDEAHADSVAYQLIQRTASAVIEAETFNARYAVMIVHSFSPAHENFSAFETFAAAFGVAIQSGQLIEVAQYRDIRLFIGWSQGDADYLLK